LDREIVEMTIRDLSPVQHLRPHPVARFKKVKISNDRVNSINYNFNIQVDWVKNGNTVKNETMGTRAI